MNESLLQDKRRLLTLLALFLVFASLFTAVKSLHEWRSYQNETYQNLGPTIDVAGLGEVNAVPDVGTFSFGVEVHAKTVADAQKQVATAMSAATDFLKKSGVAEKDIKTDSYSVAPQYEYDQTPIVCVRYPCNQPSGKQLLVGYSASENTQVKVRDTTKAGALLDGVGKLGVTNLSGVNFEIDKPEDLKRQAREMAIADAQKKAGELAADLHVSLGRLVSYSENGSSPIYYSAKAMDSMAAGAPEAVSTPLSPGENKISSNVNLTYEIR